MNWTRAASLTRESPPDTGPYVAEEWRRYWADSLAEFGITGLKPISPNSWRVATTEFKNDLVLQKVISRIISHFGGIESLVDPDNDPVFDGGLALVDLLGNVLVEPQCCADLENLTDWHEAADYRGERWQMLWVGHPWLSVRFDGERLILSDLHESEKPVVRWSINVNELQQALLDVERELRRFAGEIALILLRHGFHGNSQSMAEKLVGLRKKYQP